MSNKETALVVFEGKNFRKTWYNNEWYFSVVDVIFALTDSLDPKDYWYKLKKREKESSGIELSTICRQLKLKSSDGKKYETDCANVETMFRIIQSVPSPKAEPLKRWLAQVGYERIQEIEDPELAQDRAKEYYELKGYPKDWIDKRVRGIAIRQELTDEWKNRGIKEDKDFAILTNEISKATFDKTVEEYKKFKGLPNKKNTNLRDHMNDLELIFNMLGEKVTTEITKNKNAKKFPELKKAAKQGGQVAKNARKDTERKIGKPVMSNENYLSLEERKQKKLEKK
ncbi:MAG: phage antirepressor protein [Candidatus Diapherotrites archaeon CG08_land_8_20_14_0_20_30_16]|nr:MAG: phage antirepressor protein [Candidatus Diapherotrites archaeon CG08_land_8_20_14_0_20_30_16]